MRKGAPGYLEPEPGEHTVVVDDGLDTNRLRDCLSGLRAAELKVPAETFLHGIDNIQSLIALPIVLISYFVIPYQLPEMYVHALNNLGFTGQALFTPEEANNVAEEMERLRLEEIRRLGDGTLIEESTSLLYQMMRLESVHAAIGALLSSGITAAWTAFECLAHDVWQSILNTYPIPLGQRAFEAASAEPATDGISKKMIEVSLLAKHSYDLRNCLGDLLESKFDFTRPEGIKKAYAAAFGSTFEALRDLDTEETKSLHQIRNLFVHKAGLVDQQYKERTNSTQAIGEFVNINGTADVRKHANAAIGAGCRLLEEVDKSLIQLKAKPKSNTVT